jgi:chromosome partitioning protein
VADLPAISDDAPPDATEPDVTEPDATEKPRGPRIIAIANQKGGVGKTTTAINLSTALAAAGKRVMLFDLDPQGNASTGLGIDRNAADSGSYEVLIDGAPLADAAVATAVPGLFVVPASSDLTGAELELVTLDNREFRLRDAATTLAGENSDDYPSYDYILIDCPPALGLLTLNAFAAADNVLVPLQCEYLALEGLSSLVRTIERIQGAFNPSLSIQGIVLTMFDARNKLSTLVADDVREYFGELVYRTMIPRNVRVSEAPSHGQPVLLYDFRCPGSQAYIQLAREVLRREEGEPHE